MTTPSVPGDSRDPEGAARSAAEPPRAHRLDGDDARDWGVVGNHLASALVSLAGPDYPKAETSVKDAMAWFADECGTNDASWVPLYDVWIGWRACWLWAQTHPAPAREAAERAPQEAGASASHAPSGVNVLRAATRGLQLRGWANADMAWALMEHSQFHEYAGRHSEADARNCALCCSAVGLILAAVKAVDALVSAAQKVASFTVPEPSGTSAGYVTSVEAHAALRALYEAVAAQPRDPEGEGASAAARDLIHDWIDVYGEPREFTEEEQETVFNELERRIDAALAAARQEAREQISGFTLAESANVPEELRGSRDWWQQNAVYWRNACEDARTQWRAARQEAETLREALRDVERLTDDPDVGPDSFHKAWVVIRRVHEVADSGLERAPASASAASGDPESSELAQVRAALGAAQEALREIVDADEAVFANVLRRMARAALAASPTPPGSQPVERADNSGGEA